MARGSGVDLRSIVQHPLFLITLIASVAGWWTAFIGQIVFEAKYHAQVNTDGSAVTGSAVGVGWFSIFLQLFMIIFVFWTLATDTIGAHRFQLSIFLAINVVFGVLGVNSGIFLTTTFQRAIGVGWLLLTIVDIIWLLYFTSEEDSALLHFFNNSSSNSFSRAQPHSSTRRAQRSGSNANGNPNMGMSSNPNAYANNSYSNSKGTPGSMGGANNATGSLMNGGMSSADLGSSLAGGNEAEGVSPALIGNNGEGGQEYTLRARALYAYNASPDDPNEISFTKGEMLDIVDNSGKWWQARKSDGTKGIIPSNYVVLS